MATSDRCPLCERRKDESSTFCSLHKSASENLEVAYATWTSAFGSLSRDKYYEKLESLNETGSAVIEIIRHLRAEGAQS